MLTRYDNREPITVSSGEFDPLKPLDSNNWKILRDVCKLHAADCKLKIPSTTYDKASKSEFLEFLDGRVPEAWSADVVELDSETKPTTTKDDSESDKLEAIRDILGGGKVDEETIRRIVAEELKKKATQTMTIRVESSDRTIEIKNRQHYLFPFITKLLMANVNVALSGAAGSGKTYMCEKAAEALGLSYTLIACNAGTEDTELFGYRSPTTGEYFEGKVYKTFKDGGVLILDELDSLDPQVGCMFNAMLANGEYLFPNNEAVKAHEDFRCIVSMNTRGTGASMEYVGRNRLDQATLDRFVVVDVPYDIGLMFSLDGDDTRKSKKVKLEAGGLLDQPGQCAEIVEKAQEVAKSNNWTAIISPRAVIAARKLTAVGIGKDLIIDCVISKGLTENQAQTMKGAL